MSALSGSSRWPYTTCKQVLCEPEPQGPWRLRSAGQSNVRRHCFTFSASVMGLLRRFRTTCVQQRVKPSPLSLADCSTAARCSYLEALLQCLIPLVEERVLLVPAHGGLQSTQQPSARALACSCSLLVAGPPTLSAPDRTEARRCSSYCAAAAPLRCTCRRPGIISIRPHIGPGNLGDRLRQHGPTQR